MDFAKTVRLETPYDDAVPLVKGVFKEHGFGTLTEIDVRATLAEKLGTDMEPYVILGVCNPPLAHKALELDREVGLLLPCTVVVRRSDGGTLVQALDPQVIASLTGIAELAAVAAEASERVDAALAALAANG